MVDGKHREHGSCNSRGRDGEGRRGEGAIDYRLGTPSAPIHARSTDSSTHTNDDANTNTKHQHQTPTQNTPTTTTTTTTRPQDHYTNETNDTNDNHHNSNNVQLLRYLNRTETRVPSTIALLRLRIRWLKNWWLKAYGDLTVF